MEQFEGLYYIKNKNTGRYLTHIPSTNSYQLSSLSNSNNQLFVISTIASSNDLSLVNLLNGNVVDGGLSYENGQLVSKIVADELCVLRTAEGQYNIKYIGGLTYALNADSSTAVSWKYQTNATNDDWILEKVGYRLGDVNRDGYINATDSNLILQYAATTIDLYNAEKFLADINGDNIIDSQDSLIVLQIAAGL